MISIPGYDEDEMDVIEQRLIDEYVAQNEIVDVDEFVRKNAPPIFFVFLEKFEAARKRLSSKGILA